MASDAAVSLSKSPKLASANRPVKSKEWYRTNEPGKTFKSWREQLCVDDEEIIHGFLQQVREAMRVQELLGASLVGDYPRSRLRRMAKVLSNERKDLRCKGIPRETFIQLVKKMAVEANRREKHMKNKPVERVRKTNETEALGASELDPPHDSEASEGSAAETKKKKKKKRKKSAAIGDNIGRLDQESDNPTTSSAAVVAESLAGRPRFLFNAELVTVTVVDHDHFGPPFVAYLKDLLAANETLDIETCFGIQLAKFHRLMEARRFFNSETDVLWCAIHNLTYVLTDQNTFEITCRWQVEEQIKRDAYFAPKIGFQKCPKPLNLSVNRLSTRTFSSSYQLVSLADGGSAPQHDLGPSPLNQRGYRQRHEPSSDPKKRKRSPSPTDALKIASGTDLSNTNRDQQQSKKSTEPDEHLFLSSSKI